MVAYVVAVFLSAFLLFQIQPLIGKQILPWFGGAPAVWTACMMFFQMALLGGYLYAHCAATRLSRRQQAALHLGLLVVALFFLPVIARSWLKPEGPENPIGRILLLLGITVGAPYFMLSTTSPLLQRWYSLDHPGKSPYRLYALSNAGSLLALLSYPVLVEPNLPVKAQAWAWSAGFVLFAALTGTLAVRMWRAPAQRAGPAAEGMETAAQSAPAPSPLTRLLWLALPFNTSMLLLATTNELCQDIAVVPFLWILPLSLYLLSFIICFDHARWYYRPVFWTLALLSAGVTGWHLHHAALTGMGTQVALLSIMLFSLCMVGHGELVRLKPAASRLTLFYLLISLGSAIGAMFVALIAPLVFVDYAELKLGITGCCAVGLLAWWREQRGAAPGGKPRGSPAPFLASLALLAVVAVLVIWGTDRLAARYHVAAKRNFYGVMRVEELCRGDVVEDKCVLMHGRIRHGWQYLNPALRAEPTAYYGPHSGIGLFMNRGRGAGPVRAGIIGLGAGIVAAYGRPGDVFRFYEINPAVEELAASRFSFLKDSQARCEVVMGDARLSLEREPPQGYDLLVLDAFSGDAIPAHLLTREAFALYMRHLKPGGYIVANISNSHLDLKPVLRGAASGAGLSWVIVNDPNFEGGQFCPSLWAVMTGDVDSLSWLARRPAPDAPKPPMITWTDDYNDLFRIIIWRKASDGAEGKPDGKAPARQIPMTKPD